MNGTISFAKSENNTNSNEEIVENNNENILDEAKYALALRYNNQQQVIQRNEHIAPQLTGGSSAVAAGVAFLLASYSSLLFLTSAK